MKFLFKLTFTILVLILPSLGFAANTGIQAIGFANWTPNDVAKLADDFAQAGGSLELSFLPNEFNPNNPYSNATMFAQNLLPRLNGRLRLTAYLWFHDNRFEWSAFRPGNERASFRQSYLQRVARFDTWMNNLRRWAAERGLAGKLTIVLCPYLEDDCPNATNYLYLLNAIRAQQRSDGADAQMRRSPLANNRFRVGDLPLELHGRYTAVSGWLRKGDVFSNDGNFVWLDADTIPGSRETSAAFKPSYDTPTSFANFLRNQRSALNAGVTALFWRPRYNGLRSGGNNPPPADRRNLTPLSAGIENAAVLKTLRSK
jgi:hypothetical protein